MSTFWKAMIGLAMVLPMAAYVVGSLAASSAEQSVERTPIVIGDPSPAPSDPAATREADPLRPPEGSEGEEEPGVEDDDPDSGGPGDRPHPQQRPPAATPSPGASGSGGKTRPSTPGSKKPAKSRGKASPGKVDDNGVTVVTPKPTPVTDDDTRERDHTDDDTDTDDSDD